MEVKRPPGKESIISNETIASLQERLKQPQGFKSYGEAQQWLQTEYGVGVVYKTVHKLVRYKLRAKLKVPRRCSNKQHPQAQEVFKKPPRCSKISARANWCGQAFTLFMPG